MAARENWACEGRQRGTSMNKKRRIDGLPHTSWALFWGQSMPSDIIMVMMMMKMIIEVIINHEKLIIPPHAAHISERNKEIIWTGAYHSLVLKDFTKSRHICLIILLVLPATPGDRQSERENWLGEVKWKCRYYLNTGLCPLPALQFVVSFSLSSIMSPMSIELGRAQLFLLPQTSKQQ